MGLTRFLIDELTQAGITRELDEHDDMNGWFLKPIITLPKKDYVKLVIDARYLNSITDTSTSSRPLEPIQALRTRLNDSYFTSNNHVCAYHEMAMGFYSIYVINFHIDAKPLYDLKWGDLNFEWEKEHEKVFNIVKEKIARDTSLAILNAKYPFHIHADSSN